MYMSHPVSLKQMVACVIREIAMRQQVYPKRVAENKMKPDAMTQEINTMKAVLEELINLEIAHFKSRTKVNALYIGNDMFEVTGAFNGFSMTNVKVTGAQLNELLIEHDASKPMADRFTAKVKGA